MKESSIIILENNYKHWITLRDANYISNIDNSNIDALENVYIEEYGGHRINKWCKSCVTDMISTMYKIYDKTKNI